MTLWNCPRGRRGKRKDVLYPVEDLDFQAPLQTELKGEGDYLVQQDSLLLYPQAIKFFFGNKSARS